MGKVQHRRTVSMARTTYERLTLLAEARGLSRCGIVEMLINAEADAAGIDPDPIWRPAGPAYRRHGGIREF